MLPEVPSSHDRKTTGPASGKENLGITGPRFQVVMTSALEERMAAIMAKMEKFGFNMESTGMNPPAEVLNALKANGDPSSFLDLFYKDNPFLKTHNILTLAQAKPVIQEHVKSISDDFLRLRNILGKHESTLQKRWLKKTKDQRINLLLSAWPKMAQYHRADFRLLWQEKDPAKWGDIQHRDKFMYPDINLEDLAQAKPLLLMLDSRSRHTPATFANHDWNSKELGTGCQIILPAFLYGWIMLLRDDAYGSLHPHNLETWHTLKSGLSWVPGIGMLILETQQRLMRFLVTCSELVLHDLPLDDSSLQGAQLSPSLAIGTAVVQPSDVDLRPSLDTVVQEAPYRVPLQFDFTRLQNFVYARWAEAEDHLWALREEPSYFTETIQTLREHKEEVIRAQSDLPISWSAPRTPRFYEEIIRCTIHVAYTQVIQAADLWFQINRIVETRQKHGARIKRTEPLPKDYHTEVALLEVQVKEQINGVGMSLKSAVCASPQLRKYFTVKPNLPGEDTRITRVASRNIPPDDYFLWVISQLVDPVPALAAGNAGLLYELQRMMQADKKQKQRLTPWVAGVISSLSIAFELRRQIHLLAPGPNGPNVVELPTSPSVLQHDSERRNELVDRIQAILIEARNDAAFAKLCLPLSKFHHPSDKRQTAVTTQEMRNAEFNLDKLWAGVDQYFFEKTGETLNGLVKEKITIRDLNRTAPWIEPQAVPKVQEGKAKEKDSDEVTVSLFETTPEHTTLRENIPPIKTKVKTRGTATTRIEKMIAQKEPISIEDDVHPLFRLDKRAYKVFSSLFRLSTKDGVPGELPWNDFVHAMVSIGFAVQSLNGSAWIFSPAEEGVVGRSIIFHEPHPMSKIPYLVAKRVGRRLTRAFGWTAENFVRA
ncbi:MAG: hypothetical protein Q9166_007486 [cf. Caloplaca sp. 2 TL-2023]